MKIFTRLFCLGAGAILTATVAQAGVAGAGFDPNPYILKSRTDKATTDALRSAQIERINSILSRTEQAPSRMAATESAADVEVKPFTSFGPVYSFGDLDGPDGEVWFYTIDLENEEIKHEYFSEYRLLSFTVNLYDSHQNFVGTVKDKIDYAENEVRVPLCNVLPSITKHFFNDDDSYELVMSLAYNTTTPGVVHYRSAVYQIGAEKDKDGDDIIIATLPEIVCDVLDASVPGGPEKVFMSTMTEYFPDDFDEGGDLWEYRLASKVRMQVYGKADGTGAPKELLSYDICHQNLPGNQETTPFLITLTDNDKAYVAFSQYKETLFEPYYGSDEDIVQRASNALKIDIYELGSEAKLVQTTEIPFSKDSSDATIASFYSIGDCSYRNDINFHDFDNSGKASFIVTKGNKVVGSDEELESSYYVYGADGSLKKTIFENAESILNLSNISGCEPQIMFVSIENNEYVFNFVDLFSARRVCTISQYLRIDGSDPDPLLANLDRTPAGNSYQYAFEMRYPSEEDDCSYLRIAWFNADGSFSHTDEVSLGMGVHYAKSLIESKSLMPSTYHSDKHREYLVLIKRGGEGSSISEEFIVGQARSEEYPDGRTLLYLTPGEKGSIEAIIPYTVSSNPVLATSFYSKAGRSVDFYQLPLDGDVSGIGQKPADVTDTSISVNGNLISAQGRTIRIYSIYGICLASADESLDISILSPGTYIVKAGNAAKKIIKK